MPRGGDDIYAVPGGTLATTLTTISSTAYNAFVSDIAQDQNAARPVIAGGTGATDAATARTNLGAGNVEGPTTTVDNTVPRFNGTGGDLQTSGVSISDDDGITMGGTLNVVKTDNGATGAQIVTLHSSASPAASDIIGEWIAQGKDSGGNTENCGVIRHIVTDVTNASEDSVWAFLTRVAGTLGERLRIGAGLYMQGATGGDPGAGKINATEFQVNGSAIPFTKTYESSQQTITAAGSLTLAHGLGAKPTLVVTALQCVTAEHGYSIGDEIVGNAINEPASDKGVGLVPGATNISVRYGANATTFVALHKTTGGGVNLTNANWRLVVRAWL